MSRTRTQESVQRRVSHAKQRLEESTAALLTAGREYTGVGAQHQTRSLLSAAREYGRALERVTKVRGHG